MTRRRLLTLVSIAVLVVGLAVAGFAWQRRAAALPDAERGVRVKLALPGARETAHLVREADGRYVFHMTDDAGNQLALRPEQLAARLYEQEDGRDWIAALLNISTPAGIAWVAVGLLGQFIFAGRMIVQWLHSERVGRSEVPPIFWWMSLIGSIMLLVYFGWRVDIVGILGQGLGFVIYLRNLMLIAGAGGDELADE